MLKQRDPTSPFLEENLVQQIVIEDRNPKVIHSDLHKEIYKQMEQRNKEKSPLKYTQNVDEIQRLRQRSES